MRRFVLIVIGCMLGGTADAQGRRLVFEETVIEGEVQKPEITIFITRQNLGTEYVLELKESFIPKLITTVGKMPF